MDYSKMSDFEINASVFEALHGGAPDYKEGDGGAMVLISYEGDVVGGDAMEVEVERGVFNPCNNPSDAWPIITENRIAIIPDSAAGEWVAFNEFALYEGDWMFASDPENHSNGKNPLRCAMECFLMMQESANVPANTAGPDIR